MYRTKVSQTLHSVLCITTDKYFMCVLVVLLHARFSVVGPIPFLLAAFFFPGSSLYRKYYRTSQYVTAFEVAGWQKGEMHYNFLCI